MKKQILKSLIGLALLSPVCSSAAIVNYNSSDNIKLDTVVDLSKKVKLEFEGKEIVFTYKTGKKKENSSYLKPIELKIDWKNFKTGKIERETVLKLSPKHNVYSDRMKVQPKQEYTVSVYINDIKAKTKNQIAIGDDLKIIKAEDYKKYKDSKVKKEKKREIEKTKINTTTKEKQKEKAEDLMLLL